METDGLSVQGETPPQAIALEELHPHQREAVSLVEEILQSARLEANIVVRSIQDSYLSVEMLGTDIQATFGRNGQGLDALQLLCNTILSYRGEHNLRLMLDAEGYRFRRAETLRQRALDLAIEVKGSNREAEIGPLPPHERRLIHTALADDPDISTYSEGEEPYRKIVISPRH